MASPQAPEHDRPSSPPPGAAESRRAVRWYLMCYPYGRKGLTLGLEQELKRRRSLGEPPFEYFAPAFTETKEVDGHLVYTRTPLLFNYFFVRASENEIFRLKRFQPQYNLLRRITGPGGSYHYPYVSDSVMQTLRWIARSFSGAIPLCLLDQTLLVKGDRIRVTRGQLKGVEARLVTRPKSSGDDVMVFVDNWMCVPLLNVHPGQYEVIGLSGGCGPCGPSSCPDSPRLAGRLHDALCRFHCGEATEEDRRLAAEAFSRYAPAVAGTAAARCRLYSVLLPACTVLGDAGKRDGLLKLIKVMLPEVTAQQSLALLAVTLYGCTDDYGYHELAHRLVDPWAAEASPKKSKRTLLLRLADYDRCFGH